MKLAVLSFLPTVILLHEADSANSFFANTVDLNYVKTHIFLYHILAIHCPILQVPENGNISSSDTQYQTEVTFSCDEGYELNTSNDTKVCQSSEEWDPKVNISCSSK